jgi:hypothetical protein
VIGNVTIVANYLIFNAPETLSQFNVISKDFNTTLDGSKLQVDIKLRRIISYHLTNTYMPTITLLIIAGVILQFVNTKSSLKYIKQNYFNIIEMDNQEYNFLVKK